MKLRVGCCGFALAQSKYFETFDLVEVQQTFYQPPRAATAARWRAAAPPGFVFLVKAWQLITHEPSSPTYRRLTRPIPPAAEGRYGSFRWTDEVRAAWAETRAICEALSAPAVLFQTPASFTPSSTHRANLVRFFREIPRDGRVFVWEPRGVWEASEVKALCGELDLVHAVDPLQQLTTSRGCAYYRLHGLDTVRGSFSEVQLGKALAACDGFDEAYVLFNNVQAAADAQRFLALVGDESA